MKHLLPVFGRGFLIVTLTATNVGQIAGHHWVGAFINGCAISFVWWGNARNAAYAYTRGAREAYALGAGLGTAFGMFLVRLLYG